MWLSHQACGHHASHLQSASRWTHDSSCSASKKPQDLPSISTLETKNPPQSELPQSHCEKSGPIRLSAGSPGSRATGPSMPLLATQRHITESFSCVSLLAWLLRHTRAWAKRSLPAVFYSDVPAVFQHLLNSHSM